MWGGWPGGLILPEANHRLPEERPPRRNHGVLASPLVGFPLMVGLEIYARCRGVYRPKHPHHLHDYPLTHWPPDLSIPERPVIAFGDSFTEGIGARAEQSYPDQLSRMTGVKILNHGRSGDTTFDGLDRLKSDVCDWNPSLVLLCLGGNDLIQRITPEQTLANLRRIVGSVQAGGTPVLILGLRGSWLLGMDHDTPTRSLARELGCPLIPLILDGIWGVPWLMAEHVHPNGRGYRRVAARVASSLAELCPAQFSVSDRPGTGL